MLNTGLKYRLNYTRKANPVRPIISSLNSLTSGAEQFLHDIISPLLLECGYSVNSTRVFKEKFLKYRKKFDPSIHEVVGYDARQLFTSVNVEKTVKYIVDRIYQNIHEYFPATPETPKPPPQSLFSKFLTSVLTEFTAFNSLMAIISKKRVLVWAANYRLRLLTFS